MSKTIITIGREFGSGGRTIGKEVAARLGIECYDDKIIDETASHPNLFKALMKRREPVCCTIWL